MSKRTYLMDGKIPVYVDEEDAQIIELLLADLPQPVSITDKAALVNQLELEGWNRSDAMAAVVCIARRMSK